MELNEAEIVEFKGRYYLVTRAYEEKGSPYLFVEMGTASEGLTEAYFDKKYKD